MSKFLQLLEEVEKSIPSTEYTEKLNALISHLEGKKKVLFIATSNRWEGLGEKAKSTQLADYIASKLKNVEVIDASKLNIYCCEGNVSDLKGNHCGLIGAELKDKEKNPTGYHRCWASINNKDDELWKISKVLFEADAVVFFVSIRWGQTNSIYQKLIERLDWIENRHTTLGEDNVIKNIEAGIVAIGQNWNGASVIEHQKQVFKYYGFQVPDTLSFNWQYTPNADDESKKSYKQAPKAFQEAFDIKLDKSDYHD